MSKIFPSVQFFGNGLSPLLQGLNNPSTLLYRATYASFKISWEEANDPEYLQIETPSTDGVANANGLARLFAATIGEINGIRLLSPQLVDEARTVHSSGIDQVLNVHTNW